MAGRPLALHAHGSAEPALIAIQKPEATGLAGFRASLSGSETATSPKRMKGLEPSTRSAWQAVGG